MYFEDGQRVNDMSEEELEDGTGRVTDEQVL